MVKTVQNSKIMLKIDSLGAPACGRARGVLNQLFGIRFIVCQITGKNGAEFKNYVKN